MGVIQTRRAAPGVHPGACRAAGFNLLELMITLVVMAILAVMAAPSIGDAIQRNRVAGQANEFAAALGFARSEAIRRNGQVAICASADQSNCSGEWSDGWVVYADADCDGGADADEVLRSGGTGESIALESTDGVSVDNIEFSGRGLPDTAGPVNWALQPTKCDTDQELRRQFQLTLTGLLTVGRAYCEASS